MLLLRNNASFTDFLNELSLTSVTFGDQSGLSASKRRSALRGIRQLEQMPLHPRANQTRARLLAYLIESHDLCIRPNNPFFSRLLSTDRKHARILAAQLVLSTAAFVIRHPHLANDQRACDRAGALGVLRTYSALLRDDAAARWEYLDVLLERSRRAVNRTSGISPVSRAA